MTELPRPRRVSVPLSPTARRAPRTATPRRALARVLGTLLVLGLLGATGRALLHHWGSAPADEIPSASPPGTGAHDPLRAQARSIRAEHELAAPIAAGPAAAATPTSAPTLRPDAALSAAPPPHDGGSGTDGGSGAAAVHVLFERRGGAMLVPVTVAGPELQVEAKLLFDTGASLTTIDLATLGRLGLYITAADPTVTVQTANGRVDRTVTVIDSLAIGAARVSGGLTVAICDACAHQDVVGLLGTNFTRHFRVAIDHEAGLLVLSPRPAPADRLDDIRPFVSLTEIQGVQRGESLAVTLAVLNRSPRELRGVRVRAAPDGRAEAGFTGTVNAVPPRGQAALQLVGALAAPMRRFELRLEAASW